MATLKKYSLTNESDTNQIRQFNTLIENLSGVAYRCQNDKDWTVEFISPGVFELTGYREKDFLSTKVSWEKLIIKEDRNRVRSIVEKAISKKENFEVEYRINHLLEGEKWLWEKGIGIYDDHGELMAIEGYVQDITEQKRNQELLKFYGENLERKLEIKTSELVKKNKELEKSIQDKNKLFSIIGHDLRAPFNSLLGFSDALVEAYDEFSEEEKLEYLHTIRNSSKKLLTVLEGLLTWSRLQMGALELKKERTNLNNLLKEVTENLEINFKEKDISLVLNLDNSPISANLDKVSFSTAIHNILTNAIKFTPQGGAITMNLYRDDEDAIVTISDTGIGMKEEQVKNIMEMGASDSTSGTNGEKGCGIGLALTKEFVEKNNGIIHIESELGIGSVFKVILSPS